MVALLVLLTILVFLTADYLVHRYASRRAMFSKARRPSADSALPFPLSFPVPLGVYFDPGHTWLFVEESGTAKLGITDFARSLIGRVDRIGSLAVGEKVTEGTACLHLYHKDRVATFRSPVTGVVEEVNRHPHLRPDNGEKRSYTDAWYCRIRPDDMSQIPKKMFLGDAAGRWLNREVERLKVFLATIIPENRIAGETIQDGGLPAWGLIDQLSDSDWIKIQEKFFG